MSRIRKALVLLCLIILSGIGGGQNSAKRSPAKAGPAITQQKSHRKTTTTKSFPTTSRQLNNTRKVTRDSKVISSRGMMVRHVLLMKSTGYAIGDPYTPGTLTAFTGKRAKFGEAAVDPRVIPPGSKLFVSGYGFATASDTFLRKNRHGDWLPKKPINKIDLCFNRVSEARQHGVKPVLVSILSPIKKRVRG